MFDVEISPSEDRFSARRPRTAIVGPSDVEVSPSEYHFSARRPRTAIIGTSHSGREPLKKNWSYYKRTGSAWEDLDHVPPARLKHFVRPDLGLKAAQAIGRRYEQEQVLADMRSWALTVNRAKLREAHALKRETRERMEAYCGIRSVRTGGVLSSSASAELAQSGMLALPESLMQTALRPSGPPPARTLLEVHLHGPGFPRLPGSEGLIYPCHAYLPTEPFVQIGRFNPKRPGEGTPRSPPSRAQSATPASARNTRSASDVTF